MYPGNVPRSSLEGRRHKRCAKDLCTLLVLQHLNGSLVARAISVKVLIGISTWLKITRGTHKRGMFGGGD